MLRLTLIALTLVIAVQGDFTAARFHEIARAGLRDASSIMRAFGQPAHVAAAQGADSCNGYQESLVSRCSGWHDQLKGDSLNWTSFCTDPCWVEVSMANNTACLAQDIKNEITLLSVACETKGPQGSRCGNVITTITAEDPCSQYDHSTCTSVSHTPQCTWDNGCQRATTAAFLDQVCSPCLVDLMRAVATLTNLTGGEDIMVSSTLVQSFQGLLCTQVNNQYCVVAVADIMNNITSGLDISSSTLGTACADTTATTCLRKVLPAAASAHMADVLNNAQTCARQFSSQTSDQFRSSVNQSCLPCYRSEVVDTNRILSFANNLCTKSASGAYCVALTNFHPSDAIQNCYSQALAGTCSGSCDSTFSTFFSTYGCCLGLLAQTMNKSALVTTDDINRFWAAVNSVRRGQNSGNDGASMAPVGSQNSNCGDDEDSTNLLKLAVCPSQSDIATRMSTMCAYTRAATKIPKAMHLQLNCTAVLASQTIYNAILNAIVQDIAQNLGLPVDAITGVLFQCPTDAPAAHHFEVLTAAPATLQFVIQSDNAAATTAAAASLEAALGNGTMTFPSLTSTVNSVCTTCATPAALANLATATALVPTPAPPPPTPAPGTSAASAASVVLSIAAVIVAAVFSA